MIIDSRNKLIYRLQKRISDLKYDRYLPTDRQLEDVFLVSFPKSGNTWLRFLLANAFKLYFKIDREVNFFSIHEIIPDIHLSRNMRNQGAFGRTDIPRIIKSHTKYNPYYYRVLLLVRDPRDVLVAYYDFIKKRSFESDNYDLSSFIRSKQYGAKAWNDHTLSWYSAYKQGQIVRVFLYENLLANPEQELGKIMELFGISMPPELLAQAVDMSSKLKMKSSENKHRSTSMERSLDKPFVRLSNTKRRDQLSEADLAYIESITQSIAKLVGYVY